MSPRGFQARQTPYDPEDRRYALRAHYMGVVIVTGDASRAADHRSPKVRSDRTAGDSERLQRPCQRRKLLRPFA